MTEITIEPNQLLDGRYRIIERIADGGMATVYKATDERLERVVAIKVMHTQLAHGPQRDQFIERFHREARSAAAIANPHIVQVYDTGEWNELSFLVMEYVHGIDLRQEMNTHGTFDVRETLRIISQTLNGLASAHAAGVIHRDIKPENILLDDRGRVKITDFGLARAVSQATVSTTGMLLGTAAYLAPEIIENNDSTPQGDLYSVGIMAWEMLSGSVPFLSDNPVTMVFKHVHDDVPPLSSVCPGINPAISQFIARLTMRNLDDRPADASCALELLQMLQVKLGTTDWSYMRPASAALAPSASPSSAAPTPPVPPVDLASSAGPMMDQTRAFSPSQQKTASKQPMPNVPRLAGTNQTPIHAMPTRAMTPEGTVQGAGDSETRSLGAALEPVAPTTTVRSRKRPRTLVAAGIGLLIVALAAAGLGWWHFLGPGSYWPVPKPDDLACDAGTSCPINDVDWPQYRRILNDAGMPYTVRQEYSDDVRTGKVVSTRPGFVGAKLSKRGETKMEIILSKGVRRVAIPTDIVNPETASGKDPIKTLRQAGFTNIVHNESKDEYSQDIPAGALQSITPKPGTRIRHDSKVTLVLSKGPMPVSMPDVIGKTQNEAQSAFNDAKLKVTYTEAFNDSVPAGSVVSASVRKGAQLHWGDSVEVVVSKGPETVTVPDVRRKSVDEARKILSDLGFDVRISAPLSDIDHTVRFQSIGAGQQVPVRDKNGNKTVITLTVI